MSDYIPEEEEEDDALSVNLSLSSQIARHTKILPGMIDDMMLDEVGSDDEADIEKDKDDALADEEELEMMQGDDAFVILPGAANGALAQEELAAKGAEDSSSAGTMFDYENTDTDPEA